MWMLVGRVHERRCGNMELEHYSYFILITLTTYLTFTEIDRRVLLLDRLVISRDDINLQQPNMVTGLKL